MESETGSNYPQTRTAIEISIKIGAIFLILSWCYHILKPFAMPIAWAAIIAVAVSPACDWLERKLRLNRQAAAVVLTLALLATLVTPTYMLAANAFDSFQELAGKLERDELQVDPPAEKVKEWPLIGAKTYEIWSEAASNLDRTLKKYNPQIKEQIKPVLKKAAGFGGAILLFVLSIILSGFFMAKSSSGKALLLRFAHRLAGDAGEHFVNLSGVTVRNVTRGILGVAVIQASLAALGLYMMGIPAAPLLAFAILILAVVQISPGLILIPVSIYAYSVYSPAIATVFLVWNICVGLLDNVLKPLLMGRGSSVPTIIIFLGAIGGFIATGLIGLFVGAVIVVLGYQLFLAWLNMDQDMAEETAEEQNQS